MKQIAFFLIGISVECDISEWRTENKSLAHTFLTCSIEYDRNRIVRLVGYIE
jgi:hypothetical protein